MPAGVDSDWTVGWIAQPLEWNSTAALPFVRLGLWCDCTTLQPESDWLPDPSDGGIASFFFFFTTHIQTLML